MRNEELKNKGLVKKYTLDLFKKRMNQKEKEISKEKKKALKEISKTKLGLIFLGV